MHPTERPVVSYALLIVACVAVLSPLHEPLRDGFPLSPYPMFSNKKDGSTHVNHAVAVLEGGSETILGPRFLGTDEVLQSEVTLARAVRSGKVKTQALCKTVAERVSRSDVAGARSIEIRSVTYDSVLFFTQPKAPPIRKILRARCDVPR